MGCTTQDLGWTRWNSKIDRKADIYRPGRSSRILKRTMKGSVVSPWGRSFVGVRFNWREGIFCSLDYVATHDRAFMSHSKMRVCLSSEKVSVRFSFTNGITTLCLSDLSWGRLSNEKMSINTASGRIVACIINVRDVPSVRLCAIACFGVIRYMPMGVECDTSNGSKRGLSYGVIFGR